MQFKLTKAFELCLLITPSFYVVHLHPSCILEQDSVHNIKKKSRDTWTVINSHSLSP